MKYFAYVKYVGEDIHDGVFGAKASAAARIGVRRKSGVMIGGCFMKKWKKRMCCRSLNMVNSLFFMGS